MMRDPQGDKSPDGLSAPQNNPSNQLLERGMLSLRRRNGMKKKSQNIGDPTLSGVDSVGRIEKEPGGNRAPE
ncbi:hypothetical protein TNCV_786251 [Trichonephila clavipes]|nr:hypothetical protein TNCV_786251 [Trichonephila clavipes]